jgi:hypothetical protein
MLQVAGALDPKWPGPYKYVVIDQDLKDALIEFGRNINVPVKFSDEVKGKLRGDLGILALDFSGMACSCLWCPSPPSNADGAGDGGDHSMSRP